MPGFILSRDLQRDDEVLNTEPVVKPKPKIICLDEKTVLSVAKANFCNQIVVSSCTYVTLLISDSSLSFNPYIQSVARICHFFLDNIAGV